MANEPQPPRLPFLGCRGAQLLHDRCSSERIVALCRRIHLDLRGRRHFELGIIREFSPCSRAEHASQTKRHVLSPEGSLRILAPLVTGPPAETPGPGRAVPDRFPARYLRSLRPSASRTSPARPRRIVARQVRQIAQAE